MSNRNNTPKRRMVLRGIGATVSAIGLTGIVTGDDRYTEIITVKQGNDPVKIDTVPRDWWEHVTLARSVQDRLQENFESNEGVKSVALSLDTDTVSGRQKRRVTIKLKDDEPSISVPQTVDGVAVETEDATPIKPTANYCDTNDEDPIPGGAALTHDDTDDEYPYFTATCPVLTDDGIQCLTAGHAVGNEDFCITFDDLDIEQGEGEDYVGEVKTININSDYVLVEDDSDQSFSDRVKTSSDPERISGHVTEDGIEYWKGEPFEKYGARTCASSGTLNDVGTGGWCSGGVDWFTVEDMEAAVGDSGAPIYRIWEDPGGCEWASILGIQIAVTEEFVGNVIGCAAYEVVDEEDVEFGYSFSSCGPIT